MNSELLDKIDHAKKYFKSRFPRYSYLAEDFSQWLVLKQLEGHYATTDSFFRVSIDFLKREYRHGFNKSDLEVCMKTLGKEDEYTAEIQEAMSKLEGKDRALFGLFYKWDMTNEEIGELFDMKPNAVGQALFNIKNKVKKAYKYN